MEQKKRFLNDLSVSQLDWLLRNNNDFNDVVTEGYIESVMSWIDEALQVVKAYENTEEENTIEKLEEYAEKLRIELLKHFNDCTEIKYDYLKEQLDIMIDNEQFEGYYILGDDLSTIYLDVAYTKTLK